MARKIQILRVQHDSDNPTDKKFYGRFVADNGENLCVTQGYVAKQSLMDTIREYFPDWDIDLSTLQGTEDDIKDLKAVDPGKPDSDPEIEPTAKNGQIAPELNTEVNAPVVTEPVDDVPADATTETELSNSEGPIAHTHTPELENDLNLKGTEISEGPITQQELATEEPNGALPTDKEPQVNPAE